jgi:hypothetical protein
MTGDHVMPTEVDVYKTRTLGANDFPAGNADAFHELIAQGWTDAIRKLYPTETIIPFDYFRNAYVNAGLRIDHFRLVRQVENRLAAAGVDLHVRDGKNQLTIVRFGLNWGGVVVTLDKKSKKNKYTVPGLVEEAKNHNKKQGKRYLRISYERI